MLQDHPKIEKLLAQIPDPEIPVLTILDLGIVRDAEIKQDAVIITITPTYSGCPAMNVFEFEIVKALNDAGYQNVEIKTIYHPAWTTDWISSIAKEKLKKYGIAPPVGKSSDKSVLFQKSKTIPCPQCDSKHTTLVSQFGSTSCKALYTCKDCLEPFEYFKCL